MKPNPVFSANRIKLAVFAANIGCGTAVTLVPERLHLSWQASLSICREADRAGFEAVLPVGRWSDFGGRGGFSRDVYESYTWAAAIAQATEHTAVFSTSHVTFNHPIVAAKQSMTVDHISDGRFGLNVICGWFERESRMFGQELLEHDRRYEYADEWIAIAEKIWGSDETFDFRGEYFDLTGVNGWPKSLQQPRPVIMNAGFSARGREWTAEHADISLSPPSERTVDGVARATRAMKRLARERGGRDDLQVWIPCYVVCRPTEREARDYLKHYAVEMADNEALDFVFAQTNPAYDSASAEDKIDMRLHMAAGFSSYPLVGTPEQIVETIGELADAGLDGLCLTWVDYATELGQWTSEVMPLLERAGLRQPFRTPVHNGDRDVPVAG